VFFFDKRFLNFLVIIFLSVVSMSWTFFIFKEEIFISLMLFIAISRCIASLLLFRDYSASWSKSTPKTFLRKMLINSVVLVPTVLLFYGKVRFAIIFSEYLFYIVILNFCVFLYFYLVNRSDVRKTKSVVIYGAGAAGAKVANEFVNTEYRVKFFVDDNVLTQRRSVGGVKVISRESLKKYVISDRPDLLIIAIPSSSNKQLNIYIITFRMILLKSKSCLL